MRSMKALDIKMLSLAKFTAAIDVGMWSDSYDYTDPSKYYKDYDILFEDPDTVFYYHESNIIQFLDFEYLSMLFPVKSKWPFLSNQIAYRADKVNSLMMGLSHAESFLDEEDKISVTEFHSKLQDMMLTFPTILIIQNRKEEAQYCLER